MSDPHSIPPNLEQVSESWTYREIVQQPETLRATHSLLAARRASIDAFLSPVLAEPNLRIILAGAGTSAFIGGCLAAVLAERTGVCVEAVPTTDIVSAPHLYLTADKPTLLVSFGRSGNSPESIATVDLADRYVSTIHHLIITCNRDGALARREGAKAFVLTLPDATHDRGYAMTSSFTAMMLAAFEAFLGANELQSRIDSVISAVTSVLARAEPRVTTLARRQFSRIVYLGSGLLQSLAREAALKILELTDGAVSTMFDSTLGFRHGPKTFVNSDTLIVVFVSNDPVTRGYDRDLIDELRSDGIAGGVLAISAQGDVGETIRIDGLEKAEDIDLVFPYIVPAQLLALQTSLQRGFNVDMPNTAGTVSRVVEGVRIHAAATA